MMAAFKFSDRFNEDLIQLPTFNSPKLPFLNVTVYGINILKPSERTSFMAETNYLYMYINSIEESPCLHSQLQAL